MKINQLIFCKKGISITIYKKIYLGVIFIGFIDKSRFCCKDAVLFRKWSTIFFFIIFRGIYLLIYATGLHPKVQSYYLKLFKKWDSSRCCKKTVEIASFGALVAHLISKVRQEYGIPTSLWSTLNVYRFSSTQNKYEN